MSRAKLIFLLFWAAFASDSSLIPDEILKEEPVTTKGIAGQGVMDETKIDLAFADGKNQQSYRIGDLIALRIDVRNTGRRPAKHQTLVGGSWRPVVTGNRILLPGAIQGDIEFREMDLAPGESKTIDQVHLLLVLPDWEGDPGFQPILRVNPGEYTISFGNSGVLPLTVLPATPKQTEKLLAQYPPRKVAAQKAAKRFLAAIKDNDAETIDKLTIKLARTQEQTRQRWLRTAAQLRRAYAPRLDLLLQIAEVIGLPEDTSMPGVVGVRINGPEGAQGHYLWLRLEHSTDDWRVADGGESAADVPLKKAVLKSYDTPAASATNDIRLSEQAPESQPVMGPVIERVLSLGTGAYMLDLDTGKAIDPPAGDRLEMEMMDVVPKQVQPSDKPTGLEGKDLLAVSVDNKDWDCTPADIQRRLQNVKTNTSANLIVREELFPATWFFKTRQGGMGVLQIVPSIDNPRGVKIRYKLILWKASRPGAAVDRNGNP